MPTPRVIDDVPNTVGARIKQLREELKISVKDVAAYCGRSVQMVHAWQRSDNSNIGAFHFIRLCHILNARPEYLLFGELPVHPMRAEIVANLPVLNSSESPDMLNTMRAMEKMEISITLLRELGIADPRRAAWYFMETDRHAPEWKAGDAFIIDRTEKPYKPGFWYLVVLGDRLEMRLVVAADAGRLELADGAGKRAKRAPEAVIYIGEVMTGWRRPASQWTARKPKATCRRRCRQRHRELNRRLCRHSVQTSKRGIVARRQLRPY